MLFGIKNGRIPIGNTHMDYLRFGTGPKNLVMLPGLGDGLRTVRGMALPFFLLYHCYASEYTVYSFSRRAVLEPGSTTRDMARDILYAMDALKLEQADVFGVSMGGMLAQYLAIDFPERIGKLVLTVTSSRPNPILTGAVQEWKSMAQADDHTALMESNMRLIYTDGYYRRNRWTVPLVGKLTKPASYDRFLIMADACLNHNAYDLLHRIQCPTLILAGAEDRCLGPEASREIHSMIPDSVLRIYPGQGHGLYEEQKGFHREVLAYLTNRAGEGNGNVQ